MSTLADFAAVRLAGWTGLPPGLGLADVPFLGADPVQVLVAPVGDPPRTGRWVPCGSTVFEGGLRAWVDAGTVVLLDGDDPVDGSGEPMTAPDLGEPTARLDTVLDTLVLPNGELVYAARGLALRVNPDNNLLLGVRGFVPTTVANYRRHLRPRLTPRRPRSAAAPGSRR
jgi:hypothetical protein